MANILVVDDDDLCREVMEVTLQRDGHQVVSAADGKEGLARLDAGQFDLVVTDLFMPAMDGVELIVEMMSRRRHIPVIGVTGGLGGMIKPYVNMLRSLGACTVLAKPLAGDVLTAAVTSALRPS